MRIMFTGSRDFSKLGESIVKELITDTLDFYKKEYEDRLVVIQGGARGIDTFVKEICLDKKIKVETFLPDWDKYGKSAGIKRNIEMLKTKPDIVIALRNNNSSGTTHAIETAKKMGIETHIIYDN